MRILVAENDEPLGVFLRHGLDSANYSVDLATDAIQAEALVEQQEYDLLLLDLNLPRVDGMEVLRHVRARQSRLPIIILAHRCRIADRVHAFDEGADDFVLKPFALSELS